MAELITAPASGSQGTTQNPQSVPSGQTISGASTKSGGVQPGTAKSVLTSQQGQTLEPSALTTVSLNPAATTAVSSTSTSAKPEHHANTGILAVSLVLIVIAVGLAWAISRSAKSTTN